jgi:hypothetical protein
LFAASANFVAAQDFDYSVANTWLEKPVLHTINAAFDSAAAVGILDEKRVEYTEEGKNIFVYESYHRIVKIKDDKGIELFNKVYIPISETAQITEVKARTILPNGQVINVDSSKIKDVEEDGNKYKIFAMDGVEKGTEVEYAYTLRRNFYLFGSEMFQGRLVPYQKETFALITPSHLRFSVKGFNGFKVSPDTVINGIRVIVGYDTNVTEQEDEKYSFGEKYLKRVDYKFSYNLSTSPGVRLYTWKEFAKKAFAYYTNWTEKDLKAVDGFISQINLPQGADETKKVQFIEDYIKTNINIDKKLVAGTDAVAAIIKTKSANDEGIIKLFTAIFSRTDVNYQIVFAEDRRGVAIDEELEDWNRASDILFNFPANGKFIAPANLATRYPYLPDNFTATKGLFLKGTVIGTFKTAIGTFDTIPMEPFEGNAHNMEAVVKFDETLDTVIINSKQILKGYAAIDYRPVFVFAPKDKQEEFTKDIIKNVGNSDNITNIKTENIQLTDCADNKPLVISGTIKTTDMLENAGSKILLKIGEIIGQQVEMYQEKPRQLPIELPYPHVLDRKITVYIPDGYLVKNPNDLNFDVEYKDSGVVTLAFISSYTLTGNVIELTIHEVYRNVVYPLSQFGIFQKVINASADFNKVVLVLQKKA